MTLAGVGAGVCLGWVAAVWAASGTADAVVVARTATAVDLPDSAACSPPRLSASSASVPLAEQAPGPNRLLGELIGHLKAARPEDAGYSAAIFGRLMRDAQSNPGLRHELIARYQSETDGTAQHALASVIASFAEDEIRNVASQLSQGDARQRANAFRLLARSSQANASSLDVIQKALGTEQDVLVLSQAVAALGPRPFVHPQQAQSTVVSLSTLAEHSDPEVRGQSMRMLAQWDKTGDVAEPLLYRALTADNPERRIDAVHALAGSGLKSDRVKTALLQIVGSTAETAESRIAALQALERFPLSQDEYALHGRLSAALNGPGRAAVHTHNPVEGEPYEGNAAFSPFQR